MKLKSHIETKQKLKKKRSYWRIFNFGGYFKVEFESQAQAIREEITQSLNKYKTYNDKIHINSAI